METLFLWPPAAFLTYVVLAGLLTGFGSMLAGPAEPSALKSSTYASGEVAPARGAVPGYRPFFVIALFFAVLHLGVLVLASGTVTPVMGLYLAALALVLLVLMLG